MLRSFDCSGFAPSQSFFLKTGLFLFSDTNESKRLTRETFIPYEFYTKTGWAIFPFAGPLFFDMPLLQVCLFFQSSLYTVHASNLRAHRTNRNLAARPRLDLVMLPMRIRAHHIVVRNPATRHRHLHFPKPFSKQ
jgi:hypothetical protein